MKTLIQWVIRLLGNISADQWRAALQYVIAAEERITSGVDKRAWVLDKLKNVGVTGRAANFIVEAAVSWLERNGEIEKP